MSTRCDQHVTRFAELAQAPAAELTSAQLTQAPRGQAAEEKLLLAEDDLRNRQAEIRILSNKAKSLQGELRKSRAEHKKASDAYRVMRRKIGSMQRMLSASSGRPPTPRPDWEGVR